MLIADAAREAVEAFRQNRLRTFLTLLGMVIGTASVTAVISAGAMMKSEFLESAESIGGRLINIHQNYENFDWDNRTAMLTERDVGNLRSISPDSDFVRSNYIWLPCSRSGRSRTILVDANDPVYWDVMPKALIDGRFLGPEDEGAGSKVAVITRDLADFWFTGGAAVGKNLRVGPFEYTVVGVVDKGGSASPLDDGHWKETVFLPYSVLARQRDWTWLGGPKVPELMVRAPSMGDVREVASDIDQYLRSRYGEVDGKSRFKVEVIDGALEVVRRIFGAVSTAVLFLAGISLVVGGIGIMNVLLVAIAERTREIGVRKALGATRRDILLQFLVESLLICFIGGALGLALGVGASAAISFVLGWPFQLPWEAPVFAILLSVGTGFFFGLSPASRASRLEPVEALAVD